MQKYFGRGSTAIRVLLGALVASVGVYLATQGTVAAQTDDALPGADSAFEILAAESGASWVQEAGSGNLVFSASGGSALVSSAASFQSDSGFVVSVEYETASLDGGHELSFGLISEEAALAAPEGSNPFGGDASLYAIGVNVTGGDDVNARGLHFSDGSATTLLDTAGTRAQFGAGETAMVTLEVAEGGGWIYRINGVYEASGIMIDELDLTKSYRLAAFAQGNVDSAIRSVELENNFALGDRANVMRGTWTSSSASGAIGQAADFETLGFASVGFNTGASTSANHNAPHKVLEQLANGQDQHIHHPKWGDLSQDEPQNDPMAAEIQKIVSAGIGVQAYSNSDQFVGDNGSQYQEIADRWMNWCDTDPEAQAYLNSEPYITGTWNGSSYVDTGEFPMRKYYFCYGEFVLKDFSLRYGPDINSWVFDAGHSISSVGGDDYSSGDFADQRIFQSWANAIWAGNPDIPLAFNNGRSNANNPAFPFQTPTRFDDFTFGHAFGGNANHADKDGGQFQRNYAFVERMVETNGNVFAGGQWTWDDNVLGNFNSKVGIGAWTYGPTQAWETQDFLDWNLEIVKAGGAVSWSGSVPRGNNSAYRPWAYDLFGALDDHLLANGVVGGGGGTGGEPHTPTTTEAPSTTVPEETTTTTEAPTTTETPSTTVPEETTTTDDVIVVSTTESSVPSTTGPYEPGETTTTTATIPTEAPTTTGPYEPGETTTTSGVVVVPTTDNPVPQVDRNPVLSFSSLKDGDTISTRIPYGGINVLASDPDAGSVDGDGIRWVALVLSDAETGRFLGARREYRSTYDWGLRLRSGRSYVLTAYAVSDSSAGRGWSKTSITVTAE